MTMRKNYYDCDFEQNTFGLSSDWNFNSIEERINLFHSGSKTVSSNGRLAFVKLFLIIQKR